MRKGSIKLQNLSGGEVTSSPLLATPNKYSRLLRNFYINSEGHIKKVPGYSAASQMIEDVYITTGIDFKKADGSSSILVGGRRNGALNTVTAEFTDTSVPPPTVFSGSGVDDITYTGTYTGSKPATYELEVFYEGNGEGVYDTLRWRKNSGAWSYWTLGLENLDLPQTLDIGDGLTLSSESLYGHTVGDTWTLSIVDGLDDLTPSGTYSGTGSTTIEIEIDAQGTPDTFKWRQDGGAWTTGVAITGAEQLLADGISVTFAATTGHAYGSSWELIGTTYSGAIYKLVNGILAPIKTDFASTNPIYMSQIGDTVVCSNKSDRPVSYDGESFGNINMPFGNSVEFVGSGLNDFSANVTFTYENATYEVEIDAVGATSITPTFTGASPNPGPNDMVVPNPNYSGADADGDFEVEILTAGATDTFKYNMNGGVYITGVTGLASGVDIGEIYIKANSASGNTSADAYEIRLVRTVKTKTGFSSYTYDHWVEWRKNGGAWTEIYIPDAQTGIYQAMDSNYKLMVPALTELTAGDVYGFQIDGASNPATFRWRVDGGSWSADTDIVAGEIALQDGIKVQFSYFSRVYAGDVFSFTATRDTVKFRNITGAWTTGQIITGAYQDIVPGVQFKFTAINGHRLGDKWTIPIDQNVRIGKTYPYKNRLWGIGSDGLTAYYSALLAPTDFTSSGSGYIDFRFVLPEGDELMDICSVLNYLAFFFKNHIVVYAGVDPTAEGDFAIYQTISGLGIVSSECVVPVGSDVYFLTKKGVKNLKQVLSAGSMNVDNVSAPIDQDIVDAINANTSGVYDSAHYAKYGLVMFLIGTTMFVYNYRSNSWSRIILPTVDDGAKILGMFNDSAGAIYMGGYDYLFKFDPDTPTYNFNGQAPTYTWKTGMLRVTDADSLYFTEMILRLASFKAATLTVKARAVGFDTGYEDQSTFNEQTIEVSALTPSDIVMNFVRAPLWGAGKYIQLEITESPSVASNDDLEITGLEIQGEMGVV